MLDRLDQADRISGLSAVAGVIAAYLPWYRFDDGDHRVTANAFGAGFLGDVLFFAALATLVLLAVRHGVLTLRQEFDTERPLLVAGVIAVGAVVLQLLIGINGSGAFRSVTIGIAVALLAALGMVVGGSLRSRSATSASPIRTHHSRR